ncbi:nucleotide exchange factor GrpE [archaeon]|nr:nucleotide exchange factor GrpE [archaeon]NDB54736.1 nucleotide exchange factor GrpE [archaeon]NDB78661.1 nucleotide exchange factor GrpE [archaeon]NDF28089.1 nucleotide exchange factor GrpE [archaeon]
MVIVKKTKKQKISEDTKVESENSESKENIQEEEVVMVEISEKRLNELENAESIALENLKRERAESINYRKRLQKQRDEFAELASVRVLNKLLNVKDDLKRVIDNANDEIPPNHLEGINLVEQRLEGIFNQEGVEIIKIKEGTTLYDPNMMEAVVSQELDNVKPNTVLGVISQGFKKGERILRAAKVMISKSPNQDQKEADPSDAPSNGENKDKKEE